MYADGISDGGLGLVLLGVILLVMHASAHSGGRLSSRNAPRDKNTPKAGDR